MTTASRTSPSACASYSAVTACAAEGDRDGISALAESTYKELRNAPEVARQSQNIDSPREQIEVLRVSGRLVAGERFADWRGQASGQAADLIGDCRPALFPDRGEHRRVGVDPPGILPGDSQLRV